MSPLSLGDATPKRRRHSWCNGQTLLMKKLYNILSFHLCFLQGFKPLGVGEFTSMLLVGTMAFIAQVILCFVPML